MIKKFFKAVLMGLRNSEILIIYGKLFVAFAWLPMLVILILKIFKVNVSDAELFFLIFSTGMLGLIIYAFICHCVDAMKYQEENKGDFHTAWEATSIIGDEWDY